jgi:hypothetical protein
MLKRIMISSKPSVPNDSLISKKHSRFSHCLKSSSDSSSSQQHQQPLNLIQNEIKALKEQVSLSKSRLLSLEENYEKSLEVYEYSRKYMNDVLSFINEQNYQLKLHTKQLKEKIFLEYKQLNDENKDNGNGNGSGKENGKNDDMMMSLFHGLSSSGSSSLGSSTGSGSSDSFLQHSTLMNFTLLLEELEKRENDRLSLLEDIKVLIHSLETTPSPAATIVSSGKGSKGSKNNLLASTLTSSSTTGSSSIIPCISFDLKEIQSLPGYEHFSMDFISAPAAAVKKEEEVNKVMEEETSGSSNNGIKTDREELLQLLTNVQSSMINDEELLYDIDLFFRSPSSLNTVTSTSADDSQGVAVVSSSDLSFLENAIFSNEKLMEINKTSSSSLSPVKVKEEPGSSSSTNSTVSVNENNKTLSTTKVNELFVVLLKSKEMKGVIDSHFQKVFQVMDSSSSTAASNEASSIALSRRKRKNPADDIIQLRSVVRSRVEYDIPLLYSPLSYYADGYLGTLPISTIYSNWTTSQQQTQAAKKDIFPDIIDSRYYINSFIPSTLLNLENEIMNNLEIQTSLSIYHNCINKLIINNEELEKLLSEAKLAYSKVEFIYKSISNENEIERNRMKSTLLSYGFIKEDMIVPPSSASGSSKKKKEEKGGTVTGGGNVAYGSNDNISSSEMMMMLNSLESLSSTAGSQQGSLSQGETAVNSETTSVKSNNGNKSRKSSGGSNSRSRNSNNANKSSDTEAESVKGVASTKDAGNKRKSSASVNPSLLSQQSDSGSVASTAAENTANPAKRRRSN